MKPQLTILDKAKKLISSVKFDIKLICYNASRKTALKISKNFMHKALIIKYNNELKQNLN